MQPVAALYVETGGSYFNLPGVTPWDQKEDARTYTGPDPVVAHPPCQRWGQLGAASYARWGGQHNKPGYDGGCFKAALFDVRRYGGVLEHPAKSKAWAAFDLPKPVRGGWIKTPCGGWVCEVWQSAYSHRANKATWLYYVGKVPPPDLRWDRPKGTHQVGFQDQRGKAANKPTLTSQEAAETPPEFRDLLIEIARLSRASQ